MKARDLKSLSKEELHEKLNTLHKEQMELEFKRKTGADKPHLFRKTRRDIARLLTVLKEK
jgi:large subunit ribosomal protein L29